MDDLPRYAELHCLSNFTFLRGASHAKELIDRAIALGYEALAITDECSFAGIVRAHQHLRDLWTARKEEAKVDGAGEIAVPLPIKLIIGTEVTTSEGLKLVLLARDHDGYTALCEMITRARRAAVKGEYLLENEQLRDLGAGVCAIYVPGRAAAAARGRKTRASRRSGGTGSTSTASTARSGGATAEFTRWLEQAAEVRSIFGDKAWLAVQLHRQSGDAARLEMLLDLARQAGLRPVACGDVHMHMRTRRALQDTLTAMRLGTTVAEAGDALFPNGERHLRKRESLARIYPQALLEETCCIAEQCCFSLTDLNYQYPHEIVPAGQDMTSYLRELTLRGMRRRWPAGTPLGIRKQIARELKLIADLQYEAFFLTVQSIVKFAESEGILCQGRGSAANSLVCYCLRITAVSPADSHLLFARFLSRQRKEPPDIDVDFEHEKREKVLQHIYDTYGRRRAALAATVIHFQPRSGLREVGKALGFTLDQIERLGRTVAWWDGSETFPDRLREQGFDPAAPMVRRLLHLTGEVLNFPRHLSQHVGGFVISENPLSQLVPVENAAMADRTVIQWDKDDLESLGLLKVDCLALGMLTCLQRCFEFVAVDRPKHWELASFPPDDPDTYDMICRADTVGVFQIESRAQMSMLPRLKPRCFYDLVVEVAIVRPGPIQGQMVHPYLGNRKKRERKEPIEYPSEQLKPVLERTLGIPIFQEQVMHLAIVAAGFTHDQADQLRRSMAAWKRHGGLEPYRKPLFDGMKQRGYPEDFAERIFEQIKGFGSYGFPESHAASFAKLVYVSAWLKCHEPAAFTAALLNSLPMGFYAPAQILQDAQRERVDEHGELIKPYPVNVLPVDVAHSDWDCKLERSAGEQALRSRAREERERRGEKYPAEQDSQAALRLGFRLVRGFSQAAAERLMTARNIAAFRNVQDLVARANLDARERACLAEAGALRGLAGDRHRANWAAQAAHVPPTLMTRSPIAEERVELVPPTLASDIRTDYARLGFSLVGHPVALIREQLRARRVRTSSDLDRTPHGRRVRAAGLVTVRQRPGGGNAIFVTIEDETGVVNVVIWAALAEQQRRELLDSRVLAVDGVLEKVEGVQHLIANRLHDYSALLGELDVRSRDFH